HIPSIPATSLTSTAKAVSAASLSMSSIAVSPNMRQSLRLPHLLTRPANGSGFQPQLIGLTRDNYFGICAQSEIDRGFVHRLSRMQPRAHFGGVKHIPPARSNDIHVGQANAAKAPSAPAFGADQPSAALCPDLPAQHFQSALCGGGCAVRKGGIRIERRIDV